MSNPIVYDMDEMDILSKYNLPIRINVWNNNPDVDFNNPATYKWLRGDCSTRTISKLLDWPYDKVMDEQFKFSKVCNCMYNSSDITKFILEEYSKGIQEIKLSNPISELAFILGHLEGNYIIFDPRHMFPVMDGQIYDFVYGVAIEKQPNVLLRGLYNKAKKVYYLKR